MVTSTESGASSVHSMSGTHESFCVVSIAPGLVDVHLGSHCCRLRAFDWALSIDVGFIGIARKSPKEHRPANAQVNIILIFLYL